MNLGLKFTVNRQKNSWIFEENPSLLLTCYSNNNFNIVIGVIKMSNNFKNVRTDMAKEVFELHKSVNGVTSVEEMPFDDIEITRVKIINKHGEKVLGKPIGNYITVDIPKLPEKDATYIENATEIIAKELKSLTGEINKNDTVLIIGLGNSNITPDALGPKVAGKVLVSRHVFEYLPGLIDDKANSVCAISPGVLGITGIETGEIVKGVIDMVHPKLVIAVDSLASRSTSRINRSVQLTDTGIQPGAGLGNRRKELSTNTLGTKVIALGVPTVIYASTITQDTVDLLLDELGEKDKSHLIKMVGEISDKSLGNLVVTPKDIDQIIEDSSDLISNAIDMALHGASLEEIRIIMQ